MKCPYCKEPVERFKTECNACGEKISIIYSWVDYLKEAVNNEATKKIFKKALIIAAIIIIAAALLAGIIRAISFTANEFKSNKLTDNGYKSIVRSDNYTYVSHLHADLSELTDKIMPLVKNVSAQEKDLMKFFKKSKSKEDNTKLFNIFIINVDKYMEDAELVYNNSSATFEKLGIKTSEPVTGKSSKPIAITSPKIKCFYLLSKNNDDFTYVDFTYDHKYMLETYAPYLTDEWKDYFTLQVESESTFENLDWENPKNRPLLRKWAKKWSAFLDKYPNFIYADEFSEYVYELNSY